MQVINLRQQWDSQGELALRGDAGEWFKNLFSGVTEPWPVSGRKRARFSRNFDLDWLEIRAAERRKVGYDLHDCLGPHLTGTAFKAKVLEETLAKISPELAQSAQEVVKLINAGIDQVRRLARGLVPVEIEATGLTSALTRLADDTGKVFGITCEFRCDKTDPRFDPAMSLQLYRIVQEAIQNALKHGTARCIKIELAVSQDQICLRIADDGCGFARSGSGRGGLGLRSMKCRARAIGGSLNIESQVKRGTCITRVVQSHRPAKPSNDVPVKTPRPRARRSPESEWLESDAR